MESKRMKTPAIRWLAFACLSFLTCFLLDSGYFLRIPVLTEDFSVVSFESIAWMAAVMVIYAYGFSAWELRRVVCSAVCGVLMGLMVLLGIRYSLNERITVSLLRSVLALAAVSLLFTGSVSALFRGLERLDPKLSNVSNAKAAARRRFLLSWFVFFAMTMVVYLPVFLAVYPGIYSYDASIQVMQLYGVHPLTTHHPLLHSLYLYVCFQAGEILFHSYQAGMAMHALSQAVFMAAVFSFVLCRMRRRGAPVWLLVLSWAFLVLNPYVTVFSFVTTKDVVFGAFFLLAFDFALDLTSDPGRFLAEKRNSLVFFGTVIFLCLFRNQGIYVYWFFAGILVLAFFFTAVPKKTAARFLLGTLTVTAVWYALSGPVPQAFGIGKGDAREMLCVPMQQLARVWTEEPESLTEEEKNYIETVIDPLALEAYVRVNADPVKSGFRTEVLTQDPGKFLSVWSSVGRKNPDHYFDSFCMGNWGYWYPGQSQYWIHYILFDGAFLEPEYNILNIHRNSHFPVLEQKLREITLTPVFDSVPLLSFLLNQAFPFWLMLTAALWSIWKKKYRNLFPLLLIFGYWGTLLLGPVTSLRYALPLIYCVPRMAELLVPEETR